jgi:hypothetical protein
MSERKRWLDPKVAVMAGGICFGYRDATPEEIAAYEERLNATNDETLAC